MRPPRLSHPEGALQPPHAIFITLPEAGPVSCVNTEVTRAAPTDLECNRSADLDGVGDLCAGYPTEPWSPLLQCQVFGEGVRSSPDHCCSAKAE